MTDKVLSQKDAEIDEQLRREDQKVFMEKLQNPMSKERALWTLDMMKERAK